MAGSQISRRDFVTGAGTLAAATILAPQALAAGPSARKAALFGGGSFPDGVLSGDPTPGGATLWTRVAGVGGSGRVALEVAEDSGFRKVVARRQLTTGDSSGHTVKALVKGLKAHRRYYYRFETRNGQSIAGRFSTAAPPDSNEPVRFAFFSCQEYSFGYFNAHAALAREDVDFVVNLGDYIYADVNLPPPAGVRDGKFPGFAAQSLDDYRLRYRTYRTDADLRRMHARFPMISCWDDHEVQNDYAGGDPSGGSVTGGYNRGRRDIGYRAFFENMPTFPIGASRLYHKANFGKTVELFVLDERQYRAAQPCDDKVGPACANLGDPRSLLGNSQLQFARSGLQRSKASWKVIANELVAMPIKLRSDQYDAFDAWQGYPSEREALLGTIASVRDVVFITGDYHAFISGDVRTAAGKTVASEFVGGSVTAASEPEVKSIIRTAGFGTPDAPTMPAEELAARKAANPWYDDLDYLHHGYVLCEASKSRFRATFKKLQTIRRRSAALASKPSWTLQRGQRGLK